MGKVLDGYPWWSQLTDTDPSTGRPDVFSQSDCGEEVVSIWLAGRTKAYTDAADLRRELSGTRSDGATSGADLARLLGAHGLPASSVQTPVRNLHPSLRHEIDQNVPVAVLGTWVDIKVLHWVLMVGYGNDAMIAMEPWSGSLTAYRWGVVQSRATGLYVREATGSDN